MTHEREPGADKAEDAAEDVAEDLTPSLEIAAEDYTDVLAQRAAAFGNLALKLEHVGDIATREAGLEMLRTLARSVRVPTSATLTRVK